MVKGTGALASALRSSGATVAASPSPEAMHRSQNEAGALQGGAQASRKGTKAITVHFPEEVRRQLKTLAGEQGRFLDDLVAEAFNLVFSKYRKPEIAPRKVDK